MAVDDGRDGHHIRQHLITVVVLSMSVQSALSAALSVTTHT